MPWSWPTTLSYPFSNDPRVHRRRQRRACHGARCRLMAGLAGDGGSMDVHLDCGDLLPGHRFLITGVRHDGQSDDRIHSDVTGHVDGQPGEPMMAVTDQVRPGLSESGSSLVVYAEVELRPTPTGAFWEAVSRDGGSVVEEREHPVGGRRRADPRGRRGGPKHRFQRHSSNHGVVRSALRDISAECAVSRAHQAVAIVRRSTPSRWRRTRPVRRHVGGVCRRTGRVRLPTGGRSVRPPGRGRRSCGAC